MGKNCNVELLEKCIFCGMHFFGDKPLHVIPKNQNEPAMYECPTCHVRWYYDANSQIPKGTLPL